MYLINQNPSPVLCTQSEATGSQEEGKTRGQQQKTEMHFTIIQAESCDKVKIIIILITFYFALGFFGGFGEERETNKQTSKQAESCSLQNVSFH